ncbi:MAG: DUF302 domain-containing protein [Bacteroidales bacterium]|nr:DUF302 domain-containing protein [Bacteroidales bacterium]
MIYYINTKLHASFEQTVHFVTEALKVEGFGILTEIDMHEKLKEKLGVDFRKYKILGVCSPLHAYKALQKDDKIGTLLPCNIIIQELASNEVEVATADPVASLLAVEDSALANMAKEIREKLTRIIRSLKDKGRIRYNTLNG